MKTVSTTTNQNTPDRNLRSCIICISTIGYLFRIITYHLRRLSPVMIHDAFGIIVHNLRCFLEFGAVVRACGASARSE